METRRQTITLSIACRGFPIEVRRNAQIGSLGFVQIPLDGRLVLALCEELLHRGLAVGGVAAVLTWHELAHDLASELRANGVPVLTSIDLVPGGFEIIHAHHMPVAAGAVCRLPD